MLAMRPSQLSMLSPDDLRHLEVVGVTFSAAQWIVLIGTFFTGIGTLLTAYAALVKSKQEVRTEQEINCLDRLKVARLEAETLADELYAIRKKEREARET